MEESLWNIEQTAKYLGMSAAYVRKQIRLRSVPFFRVGGKSIRFRRADLDRWLETHSAGGELTYPREK